MCKNNKIFYIVYFILFLLSIIRIISLGSERYQTHKINHTMNPIFKAKFKFQILN